MSGIIASVLFAGCLASAVYNALTHGSPSATTVGIFGAAFLIFMEVKRPS